MIVNCLDVDGRTRRFNLDHLVELETITRSDGAMIQQAVRLHLSNGTTFDTVITGKGNVDPAAHIENNLNHMVMRRLVAAIAQGYAQGSQALGQMARDSRLVSSIMGKS